MPKTQDVPEVEMGLSREFIELYERTGDWPEDHWITLSKDWDLNLWHDDIKYYATVYPYNPSPPNNKDGVRIHEGDLLSVDLQDFEGE